MDLEIRRLTLVRTEPTGPAGGDGLMVSPDRVCVLRRRLGRTTRGPCRPREQVRAARAGTPADLIGLGWLSPGAQLALQRAAHETPEAPHLAVRLDDGLREDVWLLSGEEASVARAGAALAGVAPPGAPAAVRSGPPARGRALRSLALLAAVAAVAAVAALVMRSAGGDLIDRVQEERRSAEDPALPPTLAGARPHGVADVLRAAASARARAAGVAVVGPPRVGPRAATVRLRGPAGPFALVVHPTPAAAAAARRPGEGRRGNVVLRGAGGAPRRSGGRFSPRSGSPRGASEPPESARDAASPAEAAGHAVILSRHERPPHRRAGRRARASGDGGGRGGRARARPRGGRGRRRRRAVRAPGLPPGGDDRAPPASPVDRGPRARPQRARPPCRRPGQGDGGRARAPRRDDPGGAGARRPDRGARRR